MKQQEMYTEESDCCQLLMGDMATVTAGCDKYSRGLYLGNNGSTSPGGVNK